MISIMWFRRDLRLADNPALQDAATTGAVVPAFCLDPALLRPAGHHRVAHLLACLRALDDAVGGHLVVRSGDPARVLPRLAAEVGAARVVAAGDVGPYGRVRDATVADALAADGRALELLDSPYAIAPGILTTGSGTAYRVFTPYSRAWFAHGWADPTPAPMDPTWLSARSDPIPGSSGDLGIAAGETAANRRLDDFLDGVVDRYGHDRDRPDRSGTSRLSVDLKFGTLHPRQILARLPDNDGGHRFATELAWRDFYADVVWHRPESARQPMNGAVGALPVDDDPDLFAAWCEGRTGYPIVDAGMRQLRTQGWMHNRLRMLTASFLVKDLHLAWQDGARWFMRHLVDGDLASNQHGWQWTAGTGTDAAPYFRIFNPTTQAKRFDPEGNYVRRHVDELRDVPTRWIHEPWRQPDGPPKGYPMPVVDHAEERAETLRRYEARPR